MSIVRASRKETYTNIDNKLINDPALDWKDLGLLVFLLSKPDNWSVNAEHLAKQRKLGVKGIYTGLKAICCAGYASKKPNPNGGWDWVISDEKGDIAPSKPITMPNADNRNADNRNADNGRLVNTETTITTDFEKREGAPKPEPVIVEKTAKAIKEKPAKFIAPTLDEVIAYCMAECLNMNAETFYYFYAQKDWMVGKNKMKSWHMAAKGWATRQQDFSITTGNGHANSSKSNQKLSAVERVKRACKLDEFADITQPPFGSVIDCTDYRVGF